jgi:hypothetical protein
VDISGMASGSASDAAGNLQTAFWAAITIMDL